MPGEYAADEAKKALDLGMHVMLFSDNVTEEEERRLKEYGNEKGLLVMGPDCGTSILSGVPLAFANVIRRGSIGIAGAAGTGIQEVCAAIERFGGGISHAIGTGGRDLHESIGGLTMKNALSMLDHDPGTSVIVVVSKTARGTGKKTNSAEFLQDFPSRVLLCSSETGKKRETALSSIPQP